MQRFIAAFLLMLAGATVGAQISTQWSAVQALQAGARVLIEFPNGQRESGFVERVTDDQLLIRDRGKLKVIDRRDIESVSLREPAGQNNHKAMLKGAAIGAAIGFGFMLPYALHDDTGHATSLSVPFILGGAGAGVAIGAFAKPKPIYRDRVIYVRQ